MVHPLVKMRLSGGKEFVVTPGGIIGRLTGAAIQIADPRVSEAHALVSLRGDCFRLVALRGRVVVNGQAHSEIELKVGQQILLADDIALSVVDVVLPDTILQLRWRDEVFELMSETSSLIMDGELTLVPGYLPEALAWVASTSEGWLLRLAEGRAETLRAGRTWTIGGQPLLVEGVQRGPGVMSTQKRSEVIELVLTGDTVTLHREGYPALVLGGQIAQLISRLGRADNLLVYWKDMVEHLWPRTYDPHEKLKNLEDVVLRLRGHLRKHGLREDLVICTGDGNRQLLLYPGDRVREG